MESIVHETFGNVLYLDSRLLLPLAEIDYELMGDEAAFWREDLDEIIVCYELLDRFAWLARFRTCFASVEAPAQERACVARLRRELAAPRPVSQDR